MKVLEEFARLGVKINRLTSDSRKVAPGVAFAAYPGVRLDGRNFIAQAIERGASAVLWERDGFAWPADFDVPNLGVAALKNWVGEIASSVYGDPAQRLWTLGVTGTNGKTSVAHWLAQCLSGQGKKCALVGTLGNGFSGELTTASNTTPDAIELHAALADYLVHGAQAVAMEVSSHGLEQGRVNGVKFDVALFTNLSRDHLDYHGDMASYARAKLKLFAMPGLKHAVINLDDPIGALIATRTVRAAGVIGYGFSAFPQFDFPSLRASGLVLAERGISFNVTSQWGSGVVAAPVIGRFNAFNLLAVLGGLIASGVPFASAVALIAAIEPVAGRMQRLGGGASPLVLVDYAHTPDALEKTLEAAREIVAPQRRLICVFGCGGERDRGKRPLMGEVASRLADRVVVTSDNPRGEAPEAIIAAITAGMRSGYQVVADRGQAIAVAIAEAAPGDVILIAGKGHENYQEIQGRRLPFSDIEAAREALASANATR
jgi:UDP-N-acetylmuramoyl-L-alanyl-D-glutamate--2,6-diaminopimelate ligase